MSINCTSINDTTNTTHRHLHDEPDKHYSHQANATKPNKTNHENDHHNHEECDIIGELIGKYGKYQFYITLLLSLFQIPNTFHISSPIFQVSIYLHKYMDQKRT